ELAGLDLDAAGWLGPRNLILTTIGRVALFTERNHEARVRPRQIRPRAEVHGSLANDVAIRETGQARRVAHARSTRHLEVRVQLDPGCQAGSEVDPVRMRAFVIAMVLETQVAAVRRVERRQVLPDVRELRSHQSGEPWVAIVEA